MRDFYDLDLTLFTDYTNATTSNTANVNDLSAEMRTFYSDLLIDEAEPYLVHDQFGQKVDIPKNGGKTIQFRKYSQLPKMLTALTEGVTPDGQALNVTTIEATVSQYGGYVRITDMLDLTAVDNNLVEATKLLSSQAGRTLDTITREVLNAGTNVIYGDNSVQARQLVTSSMKLNVAAIRRAERALKAQNVPRIDGYYVAIVHPDTEYDITGDSAWIDANKYVDMDHRWISEIGKVGNVRFVESTEAKIWGGTALASDSTTLTVNGAVSANATSITFDGGTVAASALVGRKILVDGKVYTVTANTASAVTITPKAAAIADNTTIYPGEGGAAGIDIYSTLVLGANAYGVTKVTGGGLETIVKQLGSAGSADPLNQRATVGWKATKTAEILLNQNMVRLETASTFNSGAN